MPLLSDRDTVSLPQHYLLLLLCIAPSAFGTTELRQADFTWGTYIIDQPGHYRLAEDISFAPNSPATLAAAIADGTIDATTAARLGLPAAPSPVPASLAGAPLATQFRHGPLGRDPQGSSQPAGPTTPTFDPAAYGLGFFAAIVIAADHVTLDLGGHRIEQSAEHALLQRFFSVIELADAPFIPRQGPASFSAGLTSATNVLIHNGTIGRSAHHGVHGNANRNVVIANVDFEGYEVGAVALNGVTGLLVINSHAENRKDVPVLGTFSAAQFIKPYLAELVRRQSDVTLQVDGETITAHQALRRLTTAIDRVHQDLIAQPNHVHGRTQINAHVHADEYALFHNVHGTVDGNSYSFLTNQLGVAVNGFPVRPEQNGTRLTIFKNVHVNDQQSFINEIVALNAGSGPANDPVGAVWQTQNQHPDTGAPLTVDQLGVAGRYRGNVVANAQALVAKAIHAGEFANSNLDVSRSSITPAMIDWAEGNTDRLGAALLAGDEFLCNGDSMFHVNKGTIGFKIDAATLALLYDTSVTGLRNDGAAGSAACGDYLASKSHPAATLPGYGGARARGYSFAGSRGVFIRRGTAANIHAANGDATGFDLLTDSDLLRLRDVRVDGVSAGLSGAGTFDGPNPLPIASAVRVAADVTRASVRRLCATDLDGYAGGVTVQDDSGRARVSERCR